MPTEGFPITRRCLTEKDVNSPVSEPNSPVFLVDAIDLWAPPVGFQIAIPINVMIQEWIR